MSLPALTPNQRSELLALVDRDFGIRVSDYTSHRLEQAIAQVLPTTTCGTPGELLETLRTGTDHRWLNDVVEYLTVGETYFMRDLPQFSAVRETVLPELIVRRASERRLRIWSAGCSTGEETVTLAILVLEKELGSGWDVQLIGTDVNRESLRLARIGHYPARSFRATPEAIRECYFEPIDQQWRPIEPIRRMTRFAWLNMGADALAPPVTELDLIVCRNVTIYFGKEATQRLYRALVGALAPGGWLLLGPSDALPLERGDLERVEVNNAILWRRVVATDVAKRARKQAPRVAALARPRDKPSVNTRVLQEARVAPRAGDPTRAGNATRSSDSREPQRASGARSARNSRVPQSASDAPLAEDACADLETGLLALEAGAKVVALESLRRATFRDPQSVVGQFALARAELDVGEFAHARAALLHTRRLIAPLAGDATVNGAESLSVEALRQMIQTRLSAIEGRS